ncbi:hypothetical protein DH2020_042205 [Rehmannia glutinosa]|uniref:ATP-dependent RNA helicase n=1 Tax=Rehmannia glutinosa TaxID=99300 RepID=A0ABR0UN13_REHGL
MEELKKKKSLPVIPWMRDPVDISLSDSCPLNTLPFIDPRLEMALHNMGITSLFPVQVAVWQETIGPGSFERDLCINSPTGSGKTLAYALPIVQMLSTRTIKCLRALVVLPTRDLAVQVKEVFAALAPALGLSVGLAVGQSSIADEISALIQKPKMDVGICYDSEDFTQELRSSVDILVATPGRLMDHISNTNGFTLQHLCYLVVDETDRLLREAYQSWLPTVLQLAYSGNQNLFPFSDGVISPTFGSLKTIRSLSVSLISYFVIVLCLFHDYATLPEATAVRYWLPFHLLFSGVERGFKGKPHPRLVKMVLSATLTQDPSKLAQLDLHHPLFLTTGERRYQLPEHLKSYKVVCKSKLKPLYLLALLETLQGEKSIVFTSSVESTHRLCTLLNFFSDLKIKIKEYSRLQRQTIRRPMNVQLATEGAAHDRPIKTLRAFRAGEIQVLISSDAMTRGMDVEGVKRFKKLLQKADSESCPMYSVPSESVESFHSMYRTALERLKENVESEKYRKGKVNTKRPGVTRKKEKAA